ncbi:MAG: polyprenyl diphosphate synthase [bacterium]|nr:polyprenyl diphosphate synthase [bacterium]
MEKTEQIKHIVLLPDGNRRWAKQKNKGFEFGYQKGYKNISNLCDWLIKRKILFLTVFGFSTENWKRPKNQIDYLMRLFDRALIENLENFLKNKIRVNVIGNKDQLNDSLKNTIKKIEKLTKNNKKFVLNLAVNYGGKWDIVEAVKKIIRSKKPAEKINEKLINSFLSTKNCPEPDLFVRTGGEKRLSNFLLWQTAYSEVFFVDRLWPDFNEKDLEKVLKEFKNRQRRFGGGE